MSDYYADKASEKARYLMFWQSVKSRNVDKKIAANFELSYEGKNKEKKDFSGSKEFYVTYKETYIGLNYYVIFASVLAIVLFLVYFTIVSPRIKVKREEELKRKIMRDLKKSKEISR